MFLRGGSHPKLTRGAYALCVVSALTGSCGERATPPSELPAVRARLLATYGSTACAIDERDRLFCWGLAPVEQGRIATAPTYVTSAPGAVELAIFGGAYCVRTEDGRVACGGANDYGQLGDEGPWRGELRAVPGISSAKSLRASSRGFCVLSQDDELWCWGYVNQRGPSGASTDIVLVRFPPTRITTDRFDRLVGRGTICASGVGPVANRVFCENAAAVTEARALTLIEVRTLPPLPLVYAARGMVCVEAAGQAACNEPLANSQASAIRVGVPAGAQLVHVDSRVRCVLRRGELRCSSRGTDGNVPVLVDDADDAGFRRAATAPLATASLELNFGCAIETNGAIDCWGSDYVGQLGQGRPRFTARPMRVSGLSGVRELTINGGRFERNLSVVFTDDRGLLARQNNFETELEPLTGPRSAPFSNSFVDPIAPSPAPRSILTIGTTLCGVFDDGRLRCSPTEGRWTEPFGAMSAATSAYSFDWQAFCRLTVAGRVECIAHPTSSERPRDVAELANARAIASGYERVCAITAERSVRCFVRRVVDARGTVESRVETPGVDDVTHIFSSGPVVCVTKSDGALYCWGREWVAGRATNQPLEAPTRIDGVRDVRSMAIYAPSLATQSLGYACAVDAVGAVYCWGTNTFGECASSGGRFVDRPTRVEGLAPARSVVANGAQTCAVLESGDVWCWGMTTATASGGIGSIYTLDRPVRVSLPVE